MSHVFISDRRLSRETVRKRDDDDDGLSLIERRRNLISFARSEKESHSAKGTIAST